jgi:polyisoprenoid-binding protein YceI
MHLSREAGLGHIDGRDARAGRLIPAQPGSRTAAPSLDEQEFIQNSDAVHLGAVGSPMLTRLFSAFLLAAAWGNFGRAAEKPLAVDVAQSRVDVAVKVTVDSFVAKLTRYDAAVMVADDGRITSARLGFKFHDIETGKESRDKAMHKWQQTETYPEGQFVLTALQPANGNGFTAFGRLMLHGVTREIQFPVSVTRDGDRLAIDGDAPIDVREFGLPVIRMLGLLKVDPLVHVRFHLQGRAEGQVALTSPR